VQQLRDAHATPATNHMSDQSHDTHFSLASSSIWKAQKMEMSHFSIADTFTAAEDVGET